MSTRIGPSARQPSSDNLRSFRPSTATTATAAVKKPAARPPDRMEIGGPTGPQGTGTGSGGKTASVKIPPIDQHVAGGKNAIVYCGPTALAMVLKGFGLDGGKSDKSLVTGLADALGTAKQGFSRWTDIKTQAEKAGLNVNTLQGYKNAQEMIAGIKGDIDKGRPVIVSVGFSSMTGESTKGTTHFVVVTGYENGKLTVNDPWTGTVKQVDESFFAKTLDEAAGIKGWGQMVALSFAKK